MSGNVSAASDITDNFTLKAGYSNIWGGVALAENYLFSSTWNYGNGIKPVRAENYTTGFDAHFGNFTFNAGVFRSEFNNARDFSGTNPNIVTISRAAVTISAPVTTGATALSAPPTPMRC